MAARPLCATTLRKPPRESRASSNFCVGFVVVNDQDRVVIA
jgi:hypothetical protein